MVDYIAEELFKNTVLDESAATVYGFQRVGNKRFLYEALLMDAQFTLRVYVSGKDTISVELIENAFDEKYTLHLMPEATGEFIGKVKAEYRNTLADIAKNCFSKEYFKNIKAKNVANYVLKNTGVRLNFCGTNIQILQFLDAQKMISGMQF